MPREAGASSASSRSVTPTDDVDAQVAIGNPYGYEYEQVEVRGDRCYATLVDLRLHSSCRSEEGQLVDASSRRSSETTDLNVYYVRNFKVGGLPPTFKNAGETITSDCFAGGISDEANSGVILDTTALLQKPNDGVALLIHEITHALLYAPSWGVDEHDDQTNLPYAGSNVMSETVSRGTVSLDANQCGNIKLDSTIFRGDP